MSFLSGLFGTKYNDDEIVSRVQIALREDPLVEDDGTLHVSSEEGVITITGTVHKEQEKDRMEGIVHEVLRNSGLKHQRIVNDISIQ